MENLRDLKLLVLSRHPLICIQSFEEDRVIRLVERMATELQVPGFVWKATLGLARFGTSQAIYESQPAIKALQLVTSMRSDGIYLMLDLHRYLDDPIIVQYGRWLGRALRGDFGTSALHTTPVFNIILSRLPATLYLAFSSIALGMLIAIPLGARSLIEIPVAD